MFCLLDEGYLDQGAKYRTYFGMSSAYSLCMKSVSEADAWAISGAEVMVVMLAAKPWSSTIASIEVVPEELSFR
jgi:hypothetical protein